MDLMSIVSVVEKDGDFYVTSLQIAEHFEKEHKNVLQAIDNLEIPDDFRRLNFQPSNYKNSQGKNHPMFNPIYLIL